MSRPKGTVDANANEYRYGLMFPEVVIELQRELTKHPELTKKVQEEAASIEGALAIICTYCDLVVDGYYDLPDLAAKLIPLLQRKRIIVVTR